MLKKLLATVAASGALLATCLPSQAANTYLNTWTNAFSVSVPVNCSFNIPTTANSWTSDGSQLLGNNSQFGQYTLANVTGGCNVNYQMLWKLNNNGSVAQSASGPCSANGILKPQVNSSNPNLTYQFNSSLCSGTWSATIAPQLYIVMGQQNAYGGETYADTITLSISYT